MIDSLFKLGQKVKIIELGRVGRVLSIYIDSKGTQYHVRYFDNAEARTVYFYGDELVAIDMDT